MVRLSVYSDESVWKTNVFLKEFKFSVTKYVVWIFWLVILKISTYFVWLFLVIKICCFNIYVKLWEDNTFRTNSPSCIFLLKKLIFKIRWQTEVNFSLTDFSYRKITCKKGSRFGRCRLFNGWKKCIVKKNWEK